ncbi:uncharacterized protein [Elaeis guineensis]|uniref:Uncharacterized protein LOC105045848 isoform X1 n=1 Tax=Elaeis guineensis var. tenera TaxID=51953 RepID=A0A6I9R9I3_ELAGV|nr:uncharacterized protein LOC105045848 isoform X1 [Elaeis guineensis]
MLCSISTSRSSSNWLDRLHTSKGFSIPADLDLDHFLSSNPNPDPNTNSCFPPLPPPETRPSDAWRRQPHPSPPVSAAGNKTAGGKEQIFDLMGSALAELFIMGDGSAPATLRASKKSARKQPNPKACVPSISASIGGNFLAGAPAACRVTPATSPSSAENSVAEAKKSRTKARRKRGTAGSPVESDLSTYSKTEVTVIDTSSPGWKSEKLIFRKGIVWKVRDKKLWNVCRKKRKLGLVERLISEKEKEQPLIDMKVPAGKEHSRSVDEGGAHAEKRDASNESDDQIQIPKRKPKFSRSPRVPAAKDSSVYCLQVSTSRKNGLSCPRGTPKGL